MSEINGISVLTASTIARSRSSVADSNNLTLQDFKVTVVSVLNIWFAFRGLNGNKLISNTKKQNSSVCLQKE